MPASQHSFIDAASDAVARAIAQVHREAKQERELRDAEYRARMAELELRLASVSQIERRLEERLSTLKDGEPGRDGTDGAAGEAGAPGERGAPGENGEPGKDADADAIVAAVQERLQSDLETMRTDLAAAVVDAVAAIPAPQDGRSPSAEELQTLIDESVRGAVAALPVPENGKDGASVTLDDLLPVVEESVQRAVSAIPVPTNGADGRDGADGVDGKSGEPGQDAIIRYADEFAPDMIAENVAIAVRMLAEAPLIVAENQNYLTLNINPGTSPRQISKMIKTRRDDAGNLIADVIEQEA